MKVIKYYLSVLFVLLAAQTVTAQSCRPIDNQHPLWFIHVDVWYKADPQKIIDLIPDEVKPYVCLNLSLSCQFDAWQKDANGNDDKSKPGSHVYKMPQNAFQT